MVISEEYYKNWQYDDEICKKTCIEITELLVERKIPLQSIVAIFNTITTNMLYYSPVNMPQDKE